MLYNLGRIPPIAPSNPKQDPEVKETTAKKKPKPTKPPIANHREKKEKKNPPGTKCLIFYGTLNQLRMF